MGGKENREENKGKGITVKKEGKYLYLVSLFNIAPYDCRKSPQKTWEEFQKIIINKFIQICNLLVTDL